jgi:hypothetical protein
MGHHDLATETIEQRLLGSEAVIAQERAEQISEIRSLLP